MIFLSRTLFRSDLPLDTACDSCVYASTMQSTSWSMPKEIGHIMHGSKVTGFSYCIQKTTTKQFHNNVFWQHAVGAVWSKQNG
jgi:hypothetical protein